MANPSSFWDASQFQSPAQQPQIQGHIPLTASKRQSQGYPVLPPESASVSTVSLDYKLHVTPSQGAFSREDLPIGGGCGPPISLATPPETPVEGQMEIEDKPLQYRTPKQRIKKCLQSFENLPPKTRRTLRIVSIGVGSVLALLAIFFIARLSEQHDRKGETVFLEHEVEKQMEIKLDQSPFLMNEKGSPTFEDDSNLDNTDEKQINKDDLNIDDLNKDDLKEGNIKTGPKVYKDERGKAKQHNQFPEKKLPVYPYINVDRIKERRNLFHAANETEIDQTLDRVRLNLNKDRKLIQNKEIRLWELGDEPLRVLLVSTWRSGSTFLGQIIQSHPGVFQHHEPLSYLGMHQVRSGKEAFQAQQLLHRLLDCKYTDMEEYMNYTRAHVGEIIGHNKLVWKSCKEGPNRRACIDSDFLSEACKMFPVQLVKTVRLRLNLTQLLLNDQKLRVKVLFLVRDPRGVMSSRYSSVNWCTSSNDCSSPVALCQDMQGDLKVAAAFEKLYPDRFLMIKYEDLASNAEKEVGNILSFLGLEYSDSVKEFLQSSTTDDIDTPWSVSRKSSDRIALWKKQLPLQEIHAVQNACNSVLKTLKYEMLGV